MRQRPLLLAVLLVCAFVAAEVGPAAAVELISNGGFESGLSGWSVFDQAGSSGTFLVSDQFVTPLSGLPTVGPASGSFYAVSDQFGFGAHVLLQPFTVTPGRVVRLSFDMFANNWSPGGAIVHPSGLDYTSGGTFEPNQHVRVDILALGTSPFDTGAGVLANFYLGTDLEGSNPYTSYSFNISTIVRAGGTYILRFGEVDNQFFLNQGIDNVSVTESIPGTAVPEPGTLWLLGVGLIGLAVRRTRRSR